MVDIRYWNLMPKILDSELSKSNITCLPNPSPMTKSELLYGKYINVTCEVTIL